ncbi:hypothetical protein U3516DRAFT_765056 [Neocallimastix sp. 'constans']
MKKNQEIEIKYKTLNQCPSFIILNNENPILEYDDTNNQNYFLKINIFYADGTFYIAPIFSYQVFIARTYAYRIKFKYNSIEITPKIFHCDFEKLISFETENCNYNDNIEHITNNEIKALKSVSNDFIELWLKCFNDLNIKIIDKFINY